MSQRLVALIILLVLTLSPAQPVWAHAELLRSTPEANAALVSSPAQVELFFTEALEPSFSTITVFDSTGAQVDNGDARLDAADPTHLAVSLPSLSDGVYTVSWRVLSTVDGHVTAGAFPFAVGNVDAAALAAAGQANTQIRLSIGEALARWMTYLAAAMLTGGVLFILVVWQPVYRGLRPGISIESFAGRKPIRLRAIWQRVAAGAVGMLVLGSLLALLTKAGQAIGAEIAAPWTNATVTTLINTRYGALWIARVGLGIGIGAALLVVPNRNGRRVALVLAFLLLLTISLGSHAATEPRPLWPVIADWLHLISASVWIGGLTHFALGLWAMRGLPPALRTRTTSLLIPRFSALALASVGALTLTGLYSAVLRIGAWENLTGTVYGQILLTKTAIAVVMVGFGAVNLLFTSPSLKRAVTRVNGNPSLVFRFRWLVGGEIVLGALLLLSVGLLTSIPPARSASSPTGFYEAASVEDLQIELNISPGRVGINTFTVIVTANGLPIDNAKEVAVRFTPATKDLPPSEAQLITRGDGRYSLTGSFLSLPDIWQAQVVVRRENKFDAFANFNVNLGAAGTTTTAWHTFTGPLLFLAAIAYLVIFKALARTPKRRALLGGLPALVLALSSVYIFYYPDTANTTALPVNPIPPNAASVASGQALYAQYCVPCHGPNGKGDGPVGLTLSPRPADLTVHTAPGVHPDGQLYDWITNGFLSNPVMPKFRESLSDEERWHLVNYIRTLSAP